MAKRKKLLFYMWKIQAMMWFGVQCTCVCDEDTFAKVKKKIFFFFPTAFAKALNLKRFPLSIYNNV